MLGVGTHQQQSFDCSVQALELMRYGLTRIYELFFRGEDFRHVKRTIQTNKLLKGIVTLIWTTICLFLNMERQFESDNLLGVSEPKEESSGGVCGSKAKRAETGGAIISKQFKLKTERRVSRLISPQIMTPMDKHVKMFTPMEYSDTFAQNINFPTGFCGTTSQKEPLANVGKQSNLVSERGRPTIETHYNPFTNGTFDQSFATTNDLKGTKDELEGSFELCLRGQPLQIFNDIISHSPKGRKHPTVKKTNATSKSRLRESSTVKKLEARDAVVSRASVMSKQSNELQRTSAVSLKRQFASTPKAAVVARDHSGAKSAKKQPFKTDFCQSV